MLKLITIFSLSFLVFSETGFSALPNNYVNLLASEKLQHLWGQVSQSPYNHLPGLSSRLLLQALGASAALNLKPTIQVVSDEMPFGRIKFIHTHGSCAKVELVTVDSPFTGIFKSGASGLARLGWAAPPELAGYIPGMAVKFLVDSNPSVNIQVMNSLDGQGLSANFFERTFSNQIAEPTNPIIQILAGLFKRATKNPFYLPVNHLASVQKDGLKVPQAIYPDVLNFEPRHPDWISKDSHQDLRLTLVDFNSGTILYDVFGSLGDNSYRIGVLKITSQFISSKYCDEKLFFQHNTLESAGM